VAGAGRQADREALEPCADFADRFVPCSLWRVHQEAAQHESLGQRGPDAEVGRSEPFGVCAVRCDAGAGGRIVLELASAPERLRKDLVDLVDHLDRAYQHTRSRRARDELAQANLVLTQFAQAISDI